MNICIITINTKNNTKLWRGCDIIATKITASQYNDWLSRLNAVRVKHGGSNCSVSQVSVNATITATRMNSLLNTTVTYTDGSTATIGNTVTKNTIIKNNFITSVNNALNTMEAKESVRYETIAILNDSLSLSTFLPISGTNLDYDMDRFSGGHYFGKFNPKEGLWDDYEDIFNHVKRGERCAIMTIYNEDVDKRRNMRSYFIINSDFEHYQSVSNGCCCIIEVMNEFTELMNNFLGSDGSVYLYSGSSVSGGTKYQFVNYLETDDRRYYYVIFTPRRYIKIGKNDNVTGLNGETQWKRIANGAGISFGVGEHIKIYITGNKYSNTEWHFLDFEGQNPGSVVDLKNVGGHYLWAYTD